MDIYEQFGNVENGFLAGIYSDIADVIGIDGAYAEPFKDLFAKQVRNIYV